MNKIKLMITGLTVSAVLSFAVVAFAFGNVSTTAASNDEKMKNVTIVNATEDCCTKDASCCKGGSCCHRKS